MYEGDKLLTKEHSYVYTMPYRDVVIDIKREPLEEMKPFQFASYEDRVIIAGLIDKSISDIYVPDYVTEIKPESFKGCNNLQKISLPFIGLKKNKDINTNDKYFGAIFKTTEGKTTKTNGTIVKYPNTYYLPTSLKEVTIRHIDCLYDYSFGNFENNSIEKLILPNELLEIKKYAFNDLQGSLYYLNEIYFNGTIEKWNSIVKDESFNENKSFKIICTDGETY